LPRQNAPADNFLTMPPDAGNGHAAKDYGSDEQAQGITDEPERKQDYCPYSVGGSA
jgi:hypothetical protein